MSCVDKVFSTALILLLSTALAASAADLKVDLSGLRKQIEAPGPKGPDKKALNEALSKLNSCILKNKNLAEAYYLRGVVYEKLEDKTKALADLDQCIKLDPKHGNAHWYRGILFFGKDFRLAINDFDAAIANGAAKPAVYSNRGAAYLQVDQKKKALQDFDTALNMAPDQTFTRMMRAELNQQMGNYKDAIKDCDLVLADKNIPHSELGWIRKIRGTALFSVGKFDDAVLELTKAADELQGDEKAKTIFLRGAAYHKLGKEEQAKADLLAAKKLGFVPSGAASQTPVDKPIHTTSNQDTAKLEAAVKPLILSARKTLPAAKERYLKGLPAGYVFFVTIKLFEGEKFEQVFAQVKSWHDDKIEATLVSKVKLPDHHEGDNLQIAEKDVIDWTIAGPDGKEEGNLVGKFLDNWKH